MGMLNWEVKQESIMQVSWPVPNPENALFGVKQPSNALEVRLWLGGYCKWIREEKSTGNKPLLFLVFCATKTVKSSGINLMIFIVMYLVTN